MEQVTTKQQTPSRPPIPRNTVEVNPDYMISPKTLLLISGAALSFGMVIGLKFTLKGAPVKGATWKGIKALMGGTALALGASAATAYGVHKFFGVNNIREFGDKMRETIPSQADRFREVIQPTSDKISTSLHTIPGFPTKKEGDNSFGPSNDTSDEDVSEVDDMLAYKDDDQDNK